MLTRRSFLGTTSAGLLTALVSTRAAFASAPTDKRFVFIFLRGALDGLHTLAPYEDRDYQKLRATIALKGEDILDLDGYFGMHAALAPLMPLYNSGELLFVPAASTSYRERSHFDGQNSLENGSGQPFGARDGWLNRALLSLNEGDKRLGLSLGASVPLLLQGEARVQSWDNSSLPEVDEDFLQRVAMLYRADPLFSEALHDATGALKPNTEDMASMQDAPGNARDFFLSAAAAGDLLSQEAGPRIAVMELQGWDTHFAQLSRMDGLLERLADGILHLKEALGDTWSKTTVMVGSEFGRTASENASRGTDHGTGGLAILAGGSVAGSRIAGEWPGLSSSALYQGRDVLPANSYEGIFKTILMSEFGLSEGLLEDVIFPDSAALTPMLGLLRG